MRCSFISLLAGFVSCCNAGCATTEPVATAPTSPIRYEHIVREQPRLHLHLLRIDLTDPRVEVRAFSAGDDPDGPGPWQVTLQTVRAVAQREKLDAAINANFFAPRSAADIGGRKVPYFIGNWARAVGWLVCDGKVISNEPSPASLVVDRSGQVSIMQNVTRLPAGARDVVSGPQIVSHAKDLAREHVRAPRTAVGLADHGNSLVILVVDGRLESHSAGMSITELAGEMIRLGCTDAINLDGGGSSTMVLRDATDGHPKLMNRPSDGHDLAIPLSIERPVACVLGIRILRTPTTRATGS